MAGRTTYLWAYCARLSAAALVVLSSLPLVAFASLIEFFGSRASASAEESEASYYNSQTLRLLESVRNPDPEVAVGGGDITIVDGVALATDGSALPEGIGVGSSAPGEISVYVVHEGDTLSQIAEMFDVSANTIRWANDLGPKEAIQPGDTLVILPITGVRHVVAKGETIASIAKKYKGDVDEIAQFNGLHSGDSLAVGVEIIIPNGEVMAAPAKSSGSSSKLTYGGPTYVGYYMRPISGGVRTQGIHGYNGVDLATSYGAPVYAAAGGEVIISRHEGWNGGYGLYVVVRHDNGTQTLYAHNSANLVNVGDIVTQGQIIGYVGSTGRSTGSHVHFEVRGATNPF